MRVNFKGLEPDSDTHKPGIFTICANMIPTLQGYKSANSPADVGMPVLPGECINAVIAQKLDGTKRMFAATADKIYERDGQIWTDRSGTAYAASRELPWEFAQFGNSTIAANANNNMQRSTGAGFTDLVAIKARHICASNGFVIAAGTNEATYGDQSDRWWCSALRNETDWIPNIATQCTTGRLVDTPGAILAIKPLGQDLVAYKDSSIYVGRYVGPPGVWAWRLTPGHIGTLAAGSIVDIGHMHLFVGNDDLYMFDGNFARPLATPIKEWFYTAILPKKFTHRIVHIYDADRSTVYWLFSQGINEDLPTSAMVYNHIANKWGTFNPTVGYNPSETWRKFSTGLVFAGKTGDGWTTGLTWDTLPIVGKTWDDWPSVSYDSPYWSASDKVPAFFDHSNTLKSLSGQPWVSTFTSWTIAPDGVHKLKRITPIYFNSIDPGNHTMNVTIAAGMLPGQSMGNVVSSNLFDGKLDMLYTAKWFSPTFLMTGDIEIVGLDIDIVPAGRR